MKQNRGRKSKIEIQARKTGEKSYNDALKKNKIVISPYTLFSKLKLPPYL